MASRPVFSQKTHAVFFVFLALFFAAGILRLNELSLYNPDSTRYLIWGHSLAHGQGFVDATQPEADKFVVHAPLYSLLIAPVEIVFPFSLVAVKIWTLLWGIVALTLLYLWLYRMLGNIPALAGVLLLLFNPLMLMYSTEVLSEVPFLTVIILSLYLCERNMEHPKESGSFLLFLGVISVSALLREVGIALVLASVIFFLARKQPQRAVLLLFCSFVFIGGWYIRNQILVGPSPGSQNGNLSLLRQRFVTSSAASLFYELPFRGWLQLKEYVLQLGGMIFYPQFGTQQVSFVTGTSFLFNALRDFFDVAKFLLVIVVLPLMVYGMFNDVMKTSGGLFRLLVSVCYLAVVLVYPIHDIRFLFPLLPLLIYYLLRGGKQLIRQRTKEFTGRQHGYIVVATMFLMVPNMIGIQQILQTNISYQRSPIEFFQSLSRSGNYPPLFAQPWPLLGKWIRSNAPGDAVIASPAKELATMVEGRRILELDPGTPLPEFEKILRDNHVAYIITSLRWENMMTYEFSMKESHRLWFEPLYSVANLRIMKVHSMLREPDISFADIVQAPDTLTASGLLRKGRTELLGGAYGPASVTFGRALQLAPFQPEVVYQNLVVHAFRGDTSGALDHFQRLLTLTQAGSFAYVARTQMQALQLLRDAQLARATDQHDVKILDAGTMYWDLGYRQHASEIINTLLHSGSNYFFGMLWGFHYARQQGDTATAHAYLQRLEQIDSSNAVVKIFETCFAVDDSIAATNAMPEKSRLHLSLARYYRQIELNEEAIDEAERAIGLDSSNTQALIFLGEMFIQKGKPRPAIVYYGDAYTLDAHNVRASAIVDSLRVVLAGN